MSYEIIEKLKKEIEGFKKNPEWAEVGRVIEVGDGIVKILGLRNAVSQEILTIESAKGPLETRREKDTASNLGRNR